jgi:hypothetical protein
MLIVFIDAWWEYIGIREKLRSEKVDSYDSDLVAELRKKLGFNKPIDLSKYDSSSQRNHDA